MRCKNAFDAKMHFCNATRTFSFGKCSASHFVTQNVTNAFDATLTFCLQNVRKRQNAFDAKMHFGVHFTL